MGELAMAGAALRAACAEAVAAEPGLAGIAVHEVPPPGARPPYLVMSPDVATRRAWAGGGGSEHRLTLGLWVVDVGEVATLSAAVERAVATVGGARDGFRIVGASVIRTTARTAPTGWAQGVSEVRAFVEEMGHGG